MTSPQTTQDSYRVLLLENIHTDAIKLFTQAGHEVTTLPHALDEETLVKEINTRRIDILGVRSKTPVTKKVLARLRLVGCYCVGTDQVDLITADDYDVKVFNAPRASTRSVAELTIASIVMLLRQAGDRNNELHQGQWKKVSQGCYEVRGKTLGIVGYGNIGSQVSVLAEAFGMRVKYYDIVPKQGYGCAVRCETLEELLSECDIVTLHVPDTVQTRGLLSGDRLALMKVGSYLVNHARGCLVDIEALATMLESRHLAGAAIDVYPEEPEGNGSFTTPLAKCPNVFLTPHIGGSTSEAQQAIAHEVTEQLLNAILTLDT